MISELHRVLMVITIFSFWFMGFLDESEANSLGILLVLTVGLIHGANDLRIIDTFTNGKKYNKQSQLVAYILLVISTFLLFYIFPVTALIIFLAFSCYHFGEQHWLAAHSKKSGVLSGFAFLYGLLIITMILKFNISETILVLKDLIGLDVAPYLIDFIFYFSLISFLILMYRVRRHITIGLNRYFKELFLLFLLGVIFKISSLIWSFALYFTLWHAIPSLYSQIGILYGDRKSAGIITYIKHSFLYWSISIIGLVAVIFLLKEKASWIVSIFFPFVAALTIPHVLAMSKMFKSNS